MKYLEGAKLISEQHPEVLSDESSLKGGFCSEIYWPESAHELLVSVKKCKLKNLPITISGARTGITGGAVPFGGAVISTDKLKGISTTEEDFIISVKAGENLVSVAEFCRIHKPQYFYPPDPTETTASIGGTIATDASGASSYLYGSTRKWINRITILIPETGLVNIKRGEYVFKGNQLYHPTLGKIVLPSLKRNQPTKNAAGLFIHPNMDLIDLFIGSEGSLGVITEADLILCKRPYSLLSFAFFCTEEQFWQLHATLPRTSLRIRELEGIANSSLQFLERNTKRKFVDGCCWVLLTTIEAFSEAEIDTSLELISSIINEFGISSDSAWSAMTEEELANLKDFRHLLPETVNRIVALNSLKHPSIHKVSTDTAVHPDQLKEYYSLLKSKLSNSGIEFVIFGHAGQGHLHANLLPTSPAELHKAELLTEQIAIEAVNMGGTVSAEHGTGKLKKKLLGIMYCNSELGDMEKLRQEIISL